MNNEDTLTLRDQFAMAVLPRLICGLFERDDEFDRMASEISYRIADIMLEARKVKDE